MLKWERLIAQDSIYGHKKKRLQISIYKDLDTVMYPIQFNIQYIIAKEITSDSIERYV